MSRDVATGEIVAPCCGPTRTEADFLAHVQAVVATDQQASRWHLVCDQLNTHQSESLVRWVAELSSVEEDLGIKGQSGILASMSSRATFLRDPSHKVVFHYTPKTLFLAQSDRNLALDSGSRFWLSILALDSGSRFWCASCSNEVPSPALKTCKPESWLLLTMTTEPWQSRSSGPIKASL